MISNYVKTFSFLLKLDISKCKTLNFHHKMVWNQIYVVEKKFRKTFAGNNIYKRNHDVKHGGFFYHLYESAQNKSNTITACYSVEDKSSFNLMKISFKILN